MLYRLSLLSLCVFATTAMAESEATLDTIVVTGGGDRSVYDTAQPVTVLGSDDIAKNAGDNLGTLLESLPGVSNAAFGAGVGRPVIRGMSGSRVKILQNGTDTSDLSAMSSDHSPMAEPSAGEQIEIVYGPATLLYGGGAIGGVVNVIDGRIHEVIVPGLHGQVSTKYSTVDNGQHVEALVDAARGNWNLHLDGFTREASDYSSGEQGNVPAGNNSGKIENSDTSGSGGAIGLSWADGQTGFIGGAISTLEYDYAVPNLDGESFRVTPEQIRYDLKGAWTPVTGFIEELRTELTYNDYEHAETGHQDDNDALPIVDIGLFDKETWEFVTRLRHADVAGWHGHAGVQYSQQDLKLCHDHDGCDGIPENNTPWDGTLGFNLENSEREGDLYAHDTPMPLTETKQVGLFIVEHRDTGFGSVEVGARVDQITISPDPVSIAPEWRQQESYYDDYTFTPVTLSAAGTWLMDDEQRIGVSLARAQRAPEAPELFWNGDHHATFSFQLDNPDLTVETAHTFDINWIRNTENNEVRIAAYYYQFNDYIYNDLKPNKDRFHGNDVYRHEQADANFMGAEASWSRALSDSISFDISGDIVSAELADGGNLPRTPPASLLVGVDWESSQWQARAEARAVAEQTNTAENEDASDGYLMINASVGYQFLLADSELTVSLDGHNLTDQYAINHVSYLKRAAPMPGRDLRLGVRWTF
ncbi:TonB-dependent receptor [Thalassolituus sp.]|uniref:TonB-dependent receptor n=1 Tax=Thalassolituus sp. TaxID=2030822 RepID=UPI0035142B21